MRGALPFNYFPSLHALMQSEDVVCLSSQPWDDAHRSYGAVFAEMTRHWRVFFIEQDRISLSNGADLAGIQLCLDGQSVRVRKGPSGVWLVQPLIERLSTGYDVLRKRRLLCEFLQEASVHEPLMWCLDAQAVAVARGLPVALAVFSGDVQPFECADSDGLVQRWADVVLHEEAFSSVGTEINRPCLGMQVISNALSMRLAAMRA